jgi:hypothetical protein
MEIKVIYEADKNDEDIIRKAIADILKAISSSKYLIHISKIIQEPNTTNETLMENTIIMKRMNLAEVIQVQKCVAEDIFNNGEKYGQYK